MILAAICGLLAIICGALLPLAPVTVNEPTVAWPRDPALAEPTLLTLTAYRPLAMEVRFSCRAARAAAAAEQSGLVVATANPSLPEPERVGLIVRASGGQLDIRALDRSLLTHPLPTADCSYQIIGDSAGIEISRDGQQLLRIPTEKLPDVDLLTTSATRMPGATQADLSVLIRVDDEFASSQTPIKTALIVGLVAGVAGAGWFLWRIDRTVTRRPRRLRLAMPQVVDLIVPAVLLIWLFISPTTDDDGYYAAMARNSGLTGFVGNYYQFFDQSFAPFTWPFQVLGWWQQTVGYAPVLQRIPALLIGLLTWLVLRRFVGMAVEEWQPQRRWLRTVSATVLGIAFLAWWLPQVMGVRPEGIVALCGAIALVGVFVAVRRERLAPAWAAFVAAGLGFAAHPTGFTVLAPLIVGAPLLWRMLRTGNNVWGTAARLVAVVSGGVVAALAGFADGSLRDFRRGQAIFLSLQPQEDWSSEYLRYLFLLTDNPMGSYAKRAAVLLAFVALLWFVVLFVAARARRVPVPPALALTGWTTGLAFLLLWLTPSKWTHHFGALAGIGPIFLTLMLIMAVPLAKQVGGQAKLSTPVVVAAGGSVVLAVALAGRGPNSWPYAWLFGVRAPDVPPAVLGIQLGSLSVWLAVLLLLTGLVLLVVRRSGSGRDVRVAGLLATVGVVVVALLANVMYLVGTFTLAAQQDGWSLWGANLRDPLAVECSAAGGLDVADPFSAQPLRVAQRTGSERAPQTFRPGAGFYAPPPVPVGTGAATEVWGSLLPSNGSPPERTTGEIETDWYQLPAHTGAQKLGVLVAGSLRDGNSLTAVYGTVAAPAGVAVVGTERLSDGATDTAWRVLELNPPVEAGVVRLQAVDATGGTGGWLAFSVPSMQRITALKDFLAGDQPVGLAWQLAFDFPCQRPPRIVDGITEPITAAVMWGNRPLSDLQDGIWEARRGGIFGQIQRTQSALALLTRFRDHPEERRIQVYVFRSPLAADAYSVTRSSRTTIGWSTETG